jgi:hypothetical protein
MAFHQDYGRTGIMIPVQNEQQEWKTQESKGFLQEAI